MTFQLAARISLRRVGFSPDVGAVDNVYGELINTTGKKYRGRKDLVPRFFNRIMGLPSIQQNLIYKWYLDTYDAVVLDAKRTGKWDGPMLHIRGPTVSFKVITPSIYISEPLIFSHDVSSQSPSNSMSCIGAPSCRLMCL